MLQKMIDKLASRPQLFIFLRKLLENNFKTQKEAVAKYLVGQSGAVLDIGCGTGEFSVLFGPEDYIGLDTEKEYIDFAQKKYLGKFILGDAASLPFGDNYFSRILIVGVLHHLADLKAKEVLAEARRVLAPDGRLLVLEDLDSPSNNFLTNFIHRLDKGKFIRSDKGYEDLLRQDFRILESFRLASGLGVYQVFLLAKN